MCHQEQSGLPDSRTFQPQGVKQEKKKHEILGFIKPLLQEIQLQNLTIFFVVVKYFRF